MTADTFIISLPHDWVEVPIDPSEMVDAVRTHLQSVNPEALEAIEVRRSLVLLRRMAELSSRQGLAFTAVANQVLAPEGGEADPTGAPYLLTAVCWLATETSREVGVASIGFGQMRAALEPEPTQGSQSRLQPLAVVQLEAGQAIRDVTLQRNVVLESKDDEVSLLHVRYHMLIGSGEGMAVLGFVTPNVELADDLVSLFEAIAGTLEFIAA